jgi:Lrp/AsnC family leucine-responsive transcriptional regulator
VRERVGKLESSGVIQGYRAEVQPEMIGLPIAAVIGTVQDGSGDSDDVLSALRERQEIEPCYFMAGKE